MILQLPVLLYTFNHRLPRLAPRPRRLRARHFARHYPFGKKFRVRTYLRHRADLSPAIP